MAPLLKNTDTIKAYIIRYGNQQAYDGIGRSYVCEPAAFMALENFAKTIQAIGNKKLAEEATDWHELDWDKLLMDKKSQIMIGNDSGIGYIGPDEGILTNAPNEKKFDINILRALNAGLQGIATETAPIHRNYLKDYEAAKALLSYLEPMLIGMMYSTEFDTVYVATLSPISVLTDEDGGYSRRETIEEAAPFKGSGACEAEALSLAILAYVEGTNETLSLKGIRGNYNAPNKERFSKLLRLNMLLGETSSLLTG